MENCTELVLPDRNKIGKAQFLKMERFFQSLLVIGRKNCLKRLVEKLDSMALQMNPIGTKIAN